MDPVKPYVTFPSIDDFDPDRVYVSDSDKETVQASAEDNDNTQSQGVEMEDKTEEGVQKMTTDEGDLEEGELSEDYNIKEHSSQELPFIDPNPMAPQKKLGTRDSLEDEEDLLYNELPRPPTNRLDDPDANVPDYVDVIEDEEYQSPSAEDSEEDNVSNKKRRFGADKSEPNLPGFSNPNCASVAHASQDSAGSPVSPYDPFEAYAEAMQLKRKNPVWVNVWDSEVLKAAAKDFQNFSLTNNKNVKKIDRGPESFSIDTGLKEVRHNNRKRRLMAIVKEDPYPPIEDPDFSLSSDDSSSESTLAGASNVTPGVKRKPKLKQHLQTLSNEELKAYIVKTLDEKNEQLIENTIELLGKQVAINLLSDTMKVQRRGGMLVYSGARRRTPGGVFIYLLRQNKLLDQELVEKITSQNFTPVDESRPKRLGSRPKPKKIKSPTAEEQKSDDMDS